MPEGAADASGMARQPPGVKVQGLAVFFLPRGVPGQEERLAAVDGVDIVVAGVKGGDGPVRRYPGIQVIQHKAQVFLLPRGLIQLPAAGEHAAVLIVPQGGVMGLVARQVLVNKGKGRHGHRGLLSRIG